MRPVFDKSRTTFEKIFVMLIFAYFVAALVGSNVNLDIYVYAGFGSYVFIGLLAFFKPKLLFDVIRKENEEYLVRNQRKIPKIKAGIRYGGFALAMLGLSLNYIFIMFY